MSLNTTHYKEKLGDLIRENRIRKNMNQRELAKIMGVTRTTVSNWELGRTACDYFMFAHLIKLLEIPKRMVDELIS